MINLLQGDCLELMKDIPDGSVDMILCDLPYGTTQCKWDSVIPFEPLWEQYNRIIKDNGAVLLFSAQPFTASLIISNVKGFRYEIIWHKTMPFGFLNANKMPLRAHENICVFYKKLPTYNPQKWKSKPYFRGQHKTQQTAICRKYKSVNSSSSGERFPIDVIRFKNSNHGSLHPTQKPVPLLEYLIKTYTNEGDTVLDNCMGSGSTGVACVNLNRNFIGMELKSEYFQIAKDRIREAETAAMMEKK